jgi:hypothetical protein
LTSRGARKAQEWLRTCHELGWSKEEITRLHDLWLEYHDCDGNLIADLLRQDAKINTPK